MNKKIDTEDLDKKFYNLVVEDKIDIDSIENLMMYEIEDYKKELKLHIEGLIANRLEEKEIVNKKKKKCPKKESN